MYVYVIQLAPHWGFSVADYIMYYTITFNLNLKLLTTIEILLPYLYYFPILAHPVNLPVGGSYRALGENPRLSAD